MQSGVQKSGSQPTLSMSTQRGSASPTQSSPLGQGRGKA